MKTSQKQIVGISKKTKIIIGVIVGLFIISGIHRLISPNPTTIDQQTIADTPTPTVQASPKPTEDPCHQYLGTSMMVDCMKMQDAMDKGAALDKSLKAKVTFDGSALYIANLENVEWAMCTATLDDTDSTADNFQSDGFAIEPGMTEKIPWGNFSNAESVRFDYYQTKPTSVDLDCTVGGKTDATTGAYKGGEEHRSLFTL